MADLLEKAPASPHPLPAPGRDRGGLVTLFAVGALFDALDHPSEVRGRIDAAFRRPRGRRA
jgi:hypothetical protein